MAIKQTDLRRKTKPGFLCRVVNAVLFAGVIGFFVLFLWAVFLWVTSGYEYALNAVERLSVREAHWVIELSSVSLVSKKILSNELKHSMNQWVDEAKQTTQRMNSALGNHLKSVERQIIEQQDVVFLSDSFSEATAFVSQVYLMGYSCIHVLLMKVMMCLAAIPLFVLTAMAGLVDGLNQRAIRTASLGRESTYVFHKTLPLARKTLFWVLVLWISLPLSVNPTLLFLSLSALLAVVMSISASRFKKYL